MFPLKLLFLITATSLFISDALAFCGFYVAKGGASLYNEKSQVIYVRDKNRSVISMVSDYEGDYDDFALVVPIPQVLKKGQINVADPKIFQRIDDFTAPRLVEYHDDDPCRPINIMSPFPTRNMPMADATSAVNEAHTSVRVEAEYAVGEYDIVILSSQQSDDLITWLQQNGYNVSKQARDAVSSYIAKGMKFFVAKVNLQRKSKDQVKTLRPIQMAFESDMFMLPLQLGRVNSKGDQDLIIYTITRDKMVEMANYETKFMPTNYDIPLYIADLFADFYTAAFNKIHSQNKNSVFIEYAWNMNWCDPCVADPLSADELRELGVYWVKAKQQQDQPPTPSQRIMPPSFTPPVAQQPAFVTRLHLRYNENTFPDDLMMKISQQSKNFQTRYVMRHPFKLIEDCGEMSERYLKQLESRFKNQVINVVSLTGWKKEDVKSAMRNNGEVISKIPDESANWWQSLWQ
jgi:hypothetical protein